MKAYRILIIDDDESTHDILGMYLELAGYEVKGARDGAEGLEEMKRFRPDLVMLDINMPVMGGMEAMEVISGSRELRETPVLFISSLDQPGMKVKGFDLGAEDYIVKPLNRTELLARVKAALRRSERYCRNDKTMEGNLSQVSLAELLQTFDMGRKTFSIHLKEIGGVIHVDRGHVVHAGFRKFAGMDAIVRIFYVERGNFSVDFTPPPDGTDQVSISIQSALLEAMRQIDELETVVETIGPRDCRVEIGATRCPEVAKFKDLSPLGLRDLIAMMEGELTTNAMMVGMEMIERRVTLWNEAGSSDHEPEAIEPLPEEPAESAKERFDRLFETGFDLHGAQQYTAALGAWEEAALIDPDNKILNSNIATLRKKLAAAP